MFEKSKSTITFKEFQSKLNIVNNFDSDWGHFYDPDLNNDINGNYKILFKANSHNQKKILSKESKESKEVENKLNDIEKQIQYKVEIKKEKVEIKKEEEYNDNITIVIESFFSCIQVSFITFTMFYLFNCNIYFAFGTWQI